MGALADILGKPGEGVHKTRFLGLAAFDLFGTIAIGFALYYFAGFELYKAMIGIFLLGIIMHWMFGTQTALNKLLIGPACQTC